MLRYAIMGVSLGMWLSACQPQLSAATASHTTPSDEPEGVPKPPSALRYTPGVEGDSHTGPRRYLLRTTRGAELLQPLRRWHPEVIAHPRGLVLTKEGRSNDVLARHRKSSFLVNFEKPEIAELAEPLTSAPSLEALRQRVGSHSPPVSQTADAAQQAGSPLQVAQQAGSPLQVNECTRRAVWTAKLARAAGMPARVVVGYKLFADASPPIAKGHTWAQVHDGERWRNLDATPPEAREGAGELLMIGELEDEGPNYTTELARHIAHLAVDGVDAL